MSNRIILEDKVTGYGYEVAVHDPSVDRERKVTLPIQDGRLLVEAEIKKLIEAGTMSREDIIDMIEGLISDRPNDLPFVMHNNYYDKEYEIPVGVNALSQGPIMIGANGNIRLDKNSVWGIVGDSTEGSQIDVLIESSDYNQLVTGLGSNYGGATSGVRTFENMTTYINEDSHSAVFYFSVGVDLENGPEEILIHTRIFVDDNVAVESRDIYHNRNKLGSKIDAFTITVPGRSSWRIESVATDITGAGDYLKGIGVTLNRRRPK